jgi:hypothetical protein
VRILTSGELSKDAVKRGAIVASCRVSPLRCLSLSSASLAFVFDLSVWMKRGPGAPSMPFWMSRKEPMQARKENWS